MILKLRGMCSVAGKETGGPFCDHSANVGTGTSGSICGDR